MSKTAPARRRKWLKRLVLFGLFLWLLPIAATAIARTAPVRAYAGWQATRALERELGLQAEIKEVDVDPLRAEVVVRTVSLDHPTEGRFADAAALRIRPSWWALMQGSVDLHAITIEQATLFLKIRDGEIANLPPFPESEATSDDLDLPFNWFHIKDSRLVVDASPYANGELRGINISLNATMNEVLRADVRAKSGFVNHATGSDEIQRLDAVGGIGSEGIDIDLARIEVPGLKLGVRPGLLTLPLGERYRGKLDLELSVPALERWPHGWELPPVEGLLSLKADVEGAGDQPEGSAEIELFDAVIDGFGIGQRVALKAQFDRSQVAFAGTVEAIRGAGEVALDGAIELAEGLPTEVHADVRHVSFAALMEQLDVSPNAIVDWDINGTWTLKGSLDPLDLRGPMKMPNKDFVVLRDAWHQQPHRPIIGVSSSRLDGTVVLTDEALAFENVDITLPDSRLNTTVSLGFDNNLRVMARGLDWNLADASPLIDFPIGGHGTFECEVGGTFQDPIVHGSVDVADWSFNEFVFGDIQTNFEIDEDMMGVHFARIEALKNQSRYAVAGAFLDFRNDGFKAGGDLEVDRIALADFYDIFHYDGDERWEPYQGTVTGEARVDYSMDHPGDGDNGTMIATMDLGVPEATLDGYRFDRGRFAGSWTWLDHTQGYKGGILDIERFSLRKGAGTASVSGKMTHGNLDLVAVGDRISLRETEGLAERFEDVTGTWAVTASIKGTAAKPRADLDLTGTGLALDGDPIGDGRAYVRLTDKSDPWIAEALSWPKGAPPAGQKCGHAREGLARGVWPEDPPLRTADGLTPALDQPMAWVVCGSALGGQLDVDLAVGRTKVYPLRGRMELSKLKFGHFLPRSGTGTPMRGEVPGRLDFRGGAMLQPETLSGRMLLSSVHAGQMGVQMMNNGHVDVSFDDGAFTVHSADFIGPSNNSQLYIKGGGSLRGGLALNLDGTMDLGLVSALSSTVTDASGTLLLSFKVSGNAKQPAVYGNAYLRGATLKVASFPEAVRDVDGKVTFSARRILFEDFSAKVAGGRVRWAGAASLSGRTIGGYKLRVEADGLALQPRDGIDLELGGRTELAWEEGQRLPLLSGTLRVDKLVYSRPIKMNRTLGEMYARTRADADSYDPEQDILALDLHVEQSHPLFVRNNLIDAELRLETSRLPFKVVGTDQRFGVLGNMNVRKGTVRFRDASFEIKQGNITFSDETRIDPVFDLRAVTDVRRTTDQTNWHIGIHAWGSRDEFQFELSSDPYLTEDDIALLLTVGMTHSELAQLETGDLTSSAALEALATVTGVEREVHAAVPEIDDFHIASAYSEQSHRTEPQLFIGKRIAENLRLSASTGISESRDFSTGVELQLNDETSLEAVYNNQNTASSSQIGDVGVDLKWRLEFD